MKRTKENGITLIALVVTIIVLIILAGVTLSIVLGENGLLVKAGKTSENYKIEQAREKLEIVFLDASTEKYTKVSYNENEYLDNLILNSIPNSKILSNIVIVDGYSFKIDRSVPQIEDYVGQENELVFPYIELGEKIVNKENNTVTIPIYATEELNGISKIEILQDGHVIETQSYGNQKEKITLNFIAKRNGIYMVKVYSNLTITEKIEINELIPIVEYSPNGSTEYKKQYEVTVKAKEGADKVKNIKYQWTNTTAEPTESTFIDSCNNGDEIIKNEITGQWYLWTLVETESGAKKIDKSEVFYFDNQAPTVQVEGQSEKGDTLTVNISATAKDNESGIFSYSFSYSIKDSSSWSKPVIIETSDSTCSHSFTELNATNKYVFKVVVSDVAKNETQQETDKYGKYYIIKNGQLMDTNYVLGSNESVLQQREEYVYLKLYTPSYYKTGIGWKISGIDAFSKMTWKFSQPNNNQSGAWGYVLYCGNIAPIYDYRSENYPWNYDSMWKNLTIADNYGNCFTDIRTYTLSFTPKDSEGYAAIQTYYRGISGEYWREYNLYELCLE